MIKKLILYIAFKTVQELGRKNGNEFMRFEKAIIFLVVCFGLNLSEIVFYCSTFLLKVKLQFSPIWYLYILLVALFSNVLLKLTFTKAVLAKSLKHYKNTNLADNARIVGLLYFLINFALSIYLYKLNQSLN